MLVIRREVVHNQSLPLNLTGGRGSATRMREVLRGLGRREGECLLRKYGLGGSGAEEDDAASPAIRSGKGYGQQFR